MRLFFSVIVTIYNGEAFLSPCLDSILRNTSDNYELIIIDDGSTDTTRDICDNYEARYDHMKCVHTENRGIGNARQAGLDNARGDYIIFVDGDDVWDESFCLKKMEDEIKESCADLYVFGYVLRRIRQEGYRDKPFVVKAASFEDWHDHQAQFLSYFSNGLMFFCWNKIFRRQCVVENNVISIQQHMEDFRFVLAFLKAAKKIVFLPEEPYIYLKRFNNSLSSSAHLGMLDGQNLCHNLLLSLFDAEYATMIHQIMAPAYFGTVNRQLSLIDSQDNNTAAKEELAAIYDNNLVRISFSHYHAGSFSEKINVYLIQNGRYGALRLYRKMVRSVKRIGSHFCRK